MKAAERFIFSAAVGALITAAMYRGSLEARTAGYRDLAEGLWWQGQFLVDLALRSGGAPDDPTPGFARVLGVPIGLLVYGAAAYGLFWLFGRKPR